MNAAILGALAEPHRLHIVELLVREPLTVGEIAARLELRQPQASKHVRVLVDAGVVEVEAVANRRICHLRAEPFRDLDDWLAAYRPLWEARFDRLEAYLDGLGPPTSRDDTSRNEPPRKDTFPPSPEGEQP